MSNLKLNHNLFFAGEHKVSMPLVFSHDNWSHTMTSKKLELNSDGTVSRQGVNERILGAIYFCRANEYETEIHNLNVLAASSIKCWPDPKVLLSLSDRHLTMIKCIDHELVNHHKEVFRYSVDMLNYFLSNDLSFLPPFPFVVKYGQSHQGEGKLLVENKLTKIPKFSGRATIEPFFKGKSTRVLVIGEKTFGAEFVNDKSWIKNSAGADVQSWDPPEGFVEHAKKITNALKLDICGVDYIVGNDGSLHFLEANQFPGLDLNDECAKYARNYLEDKMNLVKGN